MGWLSAENLLPGRTLPSQGIRLLMLLHRAEARPATEQHSCYARLTVDRIGSASARLSGCAREDWSYAGLQRYYAGSAMAAKVNRCTAHRPFEYRRPPHPQAGLAATA